MKHALAAGIPARPAPRPRRPVDRPMRRLAALAAMLLVVVSLGFVATFMISSGDTASGRWFETAAATHRQLAARPPAAKRDPALLLAALPQLGASAFVPDLSAARLRPGGVAEVADFAGGRAVAIGYYGTRGCRLTVLITDAPLDLDDKMRKLPQQGLAAYGWRIGDLSYLVMASRMPAARLATIAGSVHWSSVRAAMPDEEIRAALRQSRKTSQPCARA